MPVICSFFGHRDAGDEIRPRLYDEIEKHIKEKNADMFYVGDCGRFDGLASGVLREMKKRYPHIAVYRVLAYLPTGGKPENGEYSALFPDGLEFVSRKFAINHRNRWIVNKSDYIIGYVLTHHGGAYEALKYAKQKMKNVVNLADCQKAPP